jgi:hypothetical protein
MPAADPPVSKDSATPEETSTEIFDTKVGTHAHGHHCHGHCCGCCCRSGTVEHSNSTNVFEVGVDTGQDLSECIDMETFEQIREMDDDGSDEFSRAIVEGFLEQAEETFHKMDEALSVAQHQPPNSLY